MIRRIVVLAGAATAGYGASLLLPQLWAALPWLAGGPLIHDLLVAPLIGGLGALVGRRRAVAAALTVTGTLLLIAVPLLWRPHPASPNPGLLDRDYPTGLAVFLGLVWALTALATLRPRSARERQVAGRDKGEN
jgi:MFS family permease